MTETFSENYILSWIIFLPAIGLLLLAFVNSLPLIRWIALGITLGDLLLSVILWVRFDRANPGLQFVERVEWMPTFNIQYAVGVDGISLLLVMLTTILTPLCVLASWTSITDRPKAFFMLILN